jgi:hypothetical protein
MDLAGQTSSGTPQSLVAPLFCGLWPPADALARWSSRSSSIDFSCPLPGPRRRDPTPRYAPSASTGCARSCTCRNAPEDHANAHRIAKPSEISVPGRHAGSLSWSAGCRLWYVWRRQIDIPSLRSSTQCLILPGTFLRRNVRRPLPFIFRKGFCSRRRWRAELLLSTGLLLASSKPVFRPDELRKQRLQCTGPLWRLWVRPLSIEFLLPLFARCLMGPCTGWVPTQPTRSFALLPWLRSSGNNRRALLRSRLYAWSPKRVHSGVRMMFHKGFCSRRRQRAELLLSTGLLLASSKPVFRPNELRKQRLRCTGPLWRLWVRPLSIEFLLPLFARCLMGPCTGWVPAQPTRSFALLPWLRSSGNNRRALLRSRLYASSPKRVHSGVRREPLSFRERSPLG